MRGIATIHRQEREASYCHQFRRRWGYSPPLTSLAAFRRIPAERQQQLVIDQLRKSADALTAGKPELIDITEEALIQLAAAKITAAIEETEAEEWPNLVPEPTELEKVVAELGRERLSNARLREVNRGLIRQREKLIGQLDTIREVIRG